jgi:hypothetical protein
MLAIHQPNPETKFMIADQAKYAWKGFEKAGTGTT